MVADHNITILTRAINNFFIRQATINIQKQDYKCKLFKNIQLILLSRRVQEYLI